MALIKNMNNSLKFVVLHLAEIAILYIVIVLFGAPFFSHQKETLTLAVLITVLTMTPATFILDTDNVISVFTDSPIFNEYISKVYIDFVQLNVKTVILGAWLGAFLIPLDWDRPWQVWPIPCVMGALVGFASTFIITFAKILKIKSKRKNKKYETLKSC